MECAEMTLTQEQVDKLVTAINDVVKVVANVLEKIVEVVKKVAKLFSDNFRKFVCKRMLNSKELHLSQHAKKCRTRKKYQKRAYDRFWRCVYESKEH